MKGCILSIRGAQSSPRSLSWQRRFQIHVALVLCPLLTDGVLPVLGNSCPEAETVFDSLWCSWNPKMCLDLVNYCWLTCLLNVLATKDEKPHMWSINKGKRWFRRQEVETRYEAVWRPTLTRQPSCCFVSAAAAAEKDPRKPAFLRQKWFSGIYFDRNY